MSKTSHAVLGFVMVVGMVVGALIEAGNYRGALTATVVAFVAASLIRTGLESRARDREEAIGLTR